MTLQIITGLGLVIKEVEHPSEIEMVISSLNTTLSLVKVSRMVVSKKIYKLIHKHTSRTTRLLNSTKSICSR